MADPKFRAITMDEFEEWLGATPKGVCSQCGRKTWDPEREKSTCGMPQPNGSLCAGTLERPARG